MRSVSKEKEEETNAHDLLKSGHHKTRKGMLGFPHYTRVVWFNLLSLTVAVPSLLALDSAKLQEVVSCGSIFRLGFIQHFFFLIHGWIMSLG